MDFQRSVSSDLLYDQAVTAGREALADQGFGVITESDMPATPVSTRRGQTHVTVMDPRIMTTRFDGTEVLAPVAEDAAQRLENVLIAVSGVKG